MLYTQKSMAELFRNDTIRAEDKSYVVSEVKKQLVQSVFKTSKKFNT